MATLIMIDSRGINLDAVSHWEDKDGRLTLRLINDYNSETFVGDERERMLRALVMNSSEY